MNNYYPGWNVIGAALVFQAVTFGTAFFSFTLWVEPWMATFGVGRSAVMLVFLLIQVVMGVLGPLIGRAFDRYSIRKLILTGGLCFSVGLFLVAQAQALWHIGFLYGTVFTFGLMLAGPLAAQKLAANWFDARRGTAIGLTSVGTSIGGATIPLLAGWALATYDWRIAHNILGFVALVVIIPVVWFIVRDTPKDAGIDPEPAATTNQIQDWPTLTTRGLLTNRNFLAIALAVPPLIFVSGAIQQNFGPYCADLAIDPQTTARLIAVSAAVMVAGKIFFGAMSDRFDHRSLFIAAITLIGLTLVLMAQTPTRGMLWLIVVLLGLGSGGMLPLLGAMVAARFGPNSFGQVMGLLGPFTLLAASGPLFAGYVRDTSGSYDGAWLISIGVLGLALLAILWLSPLERARS